MKRLASIVKWALIYGFELVMVGIAILVGTMITCYWFSMFTDKF